MLKYENPSSWRRVVLFRERDSRTVGQSDNRTVGQSDKTKLTAASNNSANAPNKDKMVIWYTTPCLLVICYRGLGEVAASVLSLVEVK
jgi:hypothetical protein